jgi:hypothetical protein
VSFHAFAELFRPPFRNNVIAVKHRPGLVAADSMASFSLKPASIMFVRAVLRKSWNNASSALATALAPLFSQSSTRRPLSCTKNGQSGWANEIAMDSSAAMSPEMGRNRGFLFFVVLPGSSENKDTLEMGRV